MTSPLEQSSSGKQWLWGLAGVVFGAVGAYAVCNRLFGPFALRDKTSQLALGMLAEQVSLPTQNAVSEAEISVLSNLDETNLDETQKALYRVCNRLSKEYRRQASLNNAELRAKQTLGNKNLNGSLKAKKELIQEAIAPVQNTLNELNSHIGNLKNKQRILLDKLDNALKSPNPASIMQCTNDLLQFHNAGPIDYSSGTWNRNCQYLRETIGLNETIPELENAIFYMTHFREKMKQSYQALFPKDESENLVDVTKICEEWNALKTLLASADLDFKKYVKFVGELASKAMIANCVTKDKSALEKVRTEYEAFMNANDQQIPQDVLSTISTALLEP